MDELGTYPSFATPGDFATWARRPLSDVDTATAQLLLDAVAAEIRKACEWQVWPALSGDTLTLDGLGGFQRVLPVSRVTAITSVVDNGITLVEGTDYDWSTKGILDRLGNRWWSKKRRGLVLVLDHGYAGNPANAGPNTAPNDLILLNCAIAGREFGPALGGIARESAGAVQVQHQKTADGVAPTVELTAGDKARLKGYRGGYR